MIFNQSARAFSQDCFPNTYKHYKTILYIDSSSLHNTDTVPCSLIRGVRSLSLLSFPYSEHGISGMLDGVLQASFVTNSKFATQCLLDTETSTN